MAKLTESEIVEKWAHIAMKLFPPQTEITPTSRDGGWVISVRWKAAEAGSPALRKGAKGVDLWFPEHAVAEYREAAVDVQLKWDAFIENAVNERLQSFDPNEVVSADQAVERWMIFNGTPVP